jgi:parallel beta-helix repeat protein
MSKKAVIALVIVFALLIPLVTVMQSKEAKAQPNIIVIPDDYSTIQSAIDAANAGDTVFVRGGSYSVGGGAWGISIDKPISLIGEGSQITIINSNAYARYGESGAIQILSDGVTVQGFSIVGNGEGLFGVDLENGNYTHQPSHCKILDNVVLNNYEGIASYSYSEFNVVAGNTVSGNSGTGIYLASSNSIISGNNVTGNSGGGIVVDSAKNVTISQNTVTGNGLENPPEFSSGINLRWYGPFYVFGNKVSGNGFGIQFGENCSNSEVYSNDIVSNQRGVNLFNFAIESSDNSVGTGNVVYKNNFNNSENAFAEHDYPFGNISNIYYATGNVTDQVCWDNGTVGNYWSDYLTKYPNATQVDSEGIGNTPYEIDANNIDHYPLLTAINISSSSPSPIASPNPTPSPSVPEFQSWILLPLLLASTLLIIYKRKEVEK